MANRLAATTLAALLIAAWLTIVFAWPIRFWATGDDYVYLSLAHAIHFEFALHNKIGPDPALLNHPGLPFYFASWLALRAAAFSSRSNEIIQSALAGPDNFFLASRIIAGLITGAAVGSAWLLLRGVTAWWRMLALLAFFATTSASFRYGLVVLGNETFALPLAVLLFWAVDLLAEAPPRATWPWLLLGSVAALGYTVKLLYLDLLVAAAAVAAVDVWWEFRGFGMTAIMELARRATLAALAFLALAGLLLVAVLGFGGLAGLLAFHASIFTHSGKYGSGEIGLVSTVEVGQALNWIAETALPYLLAIVAAGLFVSLLEKSKARTLDRRTVLWTTAALAAILSAVAAVLKHFGSHYLVSISAILPFALLPILEQRRVRWIAAAAVVAGLGVTVLQAAKAFSQESRTAAEIVEDEIKISAMPLMPNEARLWTYRIPSEKFAAAFVATYSGLPSLAATLADSSLQDFSSYSLLNRPYRYIVLDRDYFPDADTVRKTTNSLEPTQGVMVHIAPDDQINVLKRTIVVEKRTP